MFYFFPTWWYKITDLLPFRLSPVEKNNLDVICGVEPKCWNWWKHFPVTICHKLCGRFTKNSQRPEFLLYFILCRTNVIDLFVSLPRISRIWTRISQERVKIRTCGFHQRKVRSFLHKQHFRFIFVFSGYLDGENGVQTFSLFFVNSLQGIKILLLGNFKIWLIITTTLFADNFCQSQT